MSIMMRTVRVLPVLGMLWLSATPGVGDTVTDPNWIRAEESEYQFRGEVKMAIFDTPPVGIDRALAVDVQHWRFTTSYSSSGWSSDAATGVSVALSGVHEAAPDPGEMPNNVLPPITAKVRDVPFTLIGGQPKRIKFMKTGPKIGHPVLHRDEYSFKSYVSAHFIHSLSIHTIIRADHTGSSVKFPRRKPIKSLRRSKTIKIPDFDFGLPSPPKTKVNFISTGPGAGYLSFDLGQIDVLDSNGGLSDSVEPAYAADPLLGGVMTISDIPMIGTIPGGGCRFGAGTVNITDPAGNFTFDAAFDEYVIFDTSLVNPIDSYALLTDVSITDVGDVADGASPFLEDFFDETVTGAELDAAEREMILGVDLGFITSVNLATLTNGFTQTAMDVPTTIVITSNGVPLPSVLFSGVALLGATGLARRRRLA